MSLLRLGFVFRWLIVVQALMVRPCRCFTAQNQNVWLLTAHHRWRKLHSLPQNHSQLPLSIQTMANSHRSGASDLSEFWRRKISACFRSSRVALAIVVCTILSPLPSHAAPPFAVIAEELGYFPVMVPKPGSKTKETMLQYVPKRVQRHSTEQAVDLAHFLRTRPNSKVILAGTYWCSHTSRQKELFGLEAWTELNANANTGSTTTSSAIRPQGFTYLECAPQGYRGNPTMCGNLGVDGYPTWIITNAAKTSPQQTVRLSGERSLSDIAEAVGYNDGNGRVFDATLEASANPPPSMGAAACKN